jgi:hypothetical protein
LHLSDALCERELDLEMADVLPHRETLGSLVNITIAPITVVAMTGVAIATQVFSNGSNNIASVFQSLHI